MTNPLIEWTWSLGKMKDGRNRTFKLQILKPPASLSLLEQQKMTSPKPLTNWTPHDIVVYDDAGKSIIMTYKASGQVARVDVGMQLKLGELHPGIPVIEAQDFDKGTLVISNSEEDGRAPYGILVSMPVGDFLAKYPGMFCGPVYGPDTSPVGVIRDDKGQIKGTKRLVCYCNFDG